MCKKLSQLHTCNVTKTVLYVFYYRGVDPYDAPNTLYVEEKRGYGGNIVLRSSTYFSDNSENVVIQGVEDFEVREEYMFATKKVVCLTGEVWQFCMIIYKGNEFVVIDIQMMKLKNRNKTVTCIFIKGVGK